MVLSSTSSTAIGHNLSSSLHFRRLLVVIKQTAYEEYTQVCLFVLKFILFA